MPLQGALKSCTARTGRGGARGRGAPAALALAAVSLAALFALQGAAPDAVAAGPSHPHVASWGQSGLDPGHFGNPQSAAVDGEGNVYVTDLGNARVQKFNPDGVYLLSWGDTGQGAGQFTAPAGIAVGINSTVYVVDAQLHRVQAFGPDGMYVGQWGGRGQGPGQFILPSGIAVGPGGSVYVADTGNRRVQVFAANGTYVSEMGRLGVQEGDALASPSGIAVGSEGTVYVSDPAAASIKRFGPDGQPLAAYDASVGGLDLRAHGVDLAPGGGLYAADPINNRVVLLDASGAAVSSWGSEGILPGQFKLPEDVAVSASAGVLYVVDSNGHRVQAFSLPPQDESPAEQPQQRPREAPISASPAAPAAPAGADLSKPSIVPPADMTVEATGPLTPVSVGQAVATDASGIESLESNAPERFTLGISTVIWTAIDGAGNMAVATQKVTVRDTIPPAIGAVPDIVAEAAGATGTPVGLAEPQVADAVGVMSVSSDAPALFPLGATVVTWTARDVAGNEATALQNVVVEDTVRPSVRAPPDVAFEAVSAASNEVPLGEPAASDGGSGIASVAGDAPAAFQLGTTTVTWTATDAAGNEATATQEVAVLDTTPPSIEPPPDVVFEATSPALNEVDLGVPVVVDVQEVAVTSDAPAAFPLGSHAVAWNATDASGNSATAVQRVDVVDTTPPSVRVPPAMTVEAESPDGAAAALGRIAVGEAAGDGAAPDATPVASVANDAPPMLALGRTVVTWTVSDEAGNTATAAQEVNVVDTTPPAITAPADATAEAASPDGTPVEIGEPEASDAVGVASVASDAPALFPLGTTTVTWTATDAAGNEATATQEVAVLDTTPPAITAPADATAEAASEDGTPAVDLGEPDASDAVGVASVASDAPALFPLGTTTVTWTATDAAGNEATATQRVAVLDTTPPTLLAPPAARAEAAGPSTLLADIGEATASDAVGVVLLGSDAPAAYPVGETIVTWTAADAAGNAAQAQQTVTIEDATPPSIAAPADVEFEAAAADANAVDIGEPEASDAVGIASVASDAPAAFAVGNTVVTWTAADAAGNSASDSHVVSVVDTTPPSVYAPESVLAEAAGPSGTEVDHGAATASDAVGVASVASDAPALFPLGTTTVTWTAADEAGNTQTATQEVTVVDTTPPSLAAPVNVTVEAATPDGTPVDIATPEASDAVGVASVASDAPALFPLGTTTVTWTATDAAGNEATALQRITVQDTTPPAISVPDPIVLEATDPAGYPVGPGSLFELPAATDLAGSTTLESDAPPVLPLGTTTLTWTATDAAGNAATAEQEITVRDTIPPLLEAPPDIAAEASSPDGTPVEIGAPNATDVAGVASVASDAPSLFPLGTTVVIWTAADASGNEATALQRITIQDTTPPAIERPLPLSLEAGSAAGYDAAAPGQGLDPPAASDAAGPAAVTGDAPSMLPIGRTVITWTATDDAGNSAAAEQAVDVADTTPPSLAAPPDATAEASSPDGTPVDIGSPVASDAVGVASVASDAPSLFPLGTTIVNWTAVDDANNTATASQRITVQDTTPPAISVPDPIVLEATDPAGYPVGPGSLFELPAATDLAGSTTLESDAPPVLPLGTTTLTWTATDAAGNAATAEQEITVRDTIPPLLEAPPDIAAEASSPDGTPVEIGAPNATDAVGVASVSSDAPALFQLGSTTVTWTAADASGNAAAASHSVSILACGRPAAGFNVVTGTAGDDILAGTPGPDLIFALAGDDVILAGDGDDCILAGDGDDVIRGQSGDDVIRGQSGDDVIDGGDGNDACEAGGGSGGLATNCEQ